MNLQEKPRQPTVSFHCTAKKNSPSTSSLHQQPQNESVTASMFSSSDESPIDWKSRFENLQNEHQHELERLRLYYERQITEIRTQLKREYEQQLEHSNSTKLDVDQSIDEQIDLAQENDRNDDEQQAFLTKQSNDSDEFAEIVRRLHNEGTQVLTLSKRLTLQLNDMNSNTKEDSIESIQKLLEENSLLRSLIANMNANESASTLIKYLANVFRCEQERRLLQIQQHSNVNQLEEEIHAMCNYQRQALAIFFSNDHHSVNNDLQQSPKSNKFYWRYIRSETHRKALIYQKRYLLVLLTGYQDTETYALNAIRCLTGDNRLSSYSNDKMKSIYRPSYQRRAFDYRFRFRYHIRVVIAIIRMRRLVQKWTQNLASIKQ